MIRYVGAELVSALFYGGFFLTKKGKRFMNKWGVIATWKMAYSGVMTAAEMLEGGVCAGNSMTEAIMDVENNPEFASVGYGGLPNSEGAVELDAAYMDGVNLHFGAVAAVQHYANPILIARALSEYRVNSFLAGRGAEQFAERMGLQKKLLLTEKSEQRWREKLDGFDEQFFSSYDGHDTISCVCLDMTGGITAGTSTSGLFMKHPGRVGDSPLIGSGLYADNCGGACATGVGEDIMKGCLSYEIVRLMSTGMSPKDAARTAYENFYKKYEGRIGKPGNMSVICMNSDGEFGAASNIRFPFVAANHENKTSFYLCERDGGRQAIARVSAEALEGID